MGGCKPGAAGCLCAPCSARVGSWLCLAQGGLQAECPSFHYSLIGDPSVRPPPCTALMTEVLCGSCHWAGVCRLFLLDSCHLWSHNWSVSLQGQQFFMPWSHWGRQWQNGWWTGLLGWGDKNIFVMSPPWISLRSGSGMWDRHWSVCREVSLYVGTVWDGSCYCSLSGFVSGNWSQQVLPEPWRQKSIQPYRRLEEKCLTTLSFLDSHSSLQWGEAFLCCPASIWYRWQVNKEK